MQFERLIRFTFPLAMLAVSAVVRADALRLSADKARQMCERVLELANAGTLEHSLLPFERLSVAEAEKWEEDKKVRGGVQLYNPDAKLFADLDGQGDLKRFYRMVGGGTCRSVAIVEADAAASRPVVAPDYIGVGDEAAIHDDDDLRWAGWGNTEHFLLVLGEPTVVSGRVGPGRDNVSLVSWYREGRKRPLCSFERTAEIVQNVAASDDEQLCRAALQPEKIAVAMAPGSEEVAGMLRRRPVKVDRLSLAVVDLNRDGAVDNIARGVWDSGAGCGRDGITSFYNLSSDLSRVLDTPLQNVLEHNAWGPLPYGATPEDIVAKVIQFRERPYILGAADGGVGVYSVWGDERKQWCEIRQRPLFRIKKLYPPRFE